MQKCVVVFLEGLHYAGHKLDGPLPVWISGDCSD